jgi:hypothetical protein
MQPNLVGLMQKRKPPILHQVMEMGGGLMVHKFFFQMTNLKLQRAGGGGGGGGGGSIYICAFMCYFLSSFVTCFWSGFICDPISMIL